MKILVLGMVMDISVIELEIIVTPLQFLYTILDNGISIQFDKFFLFPEHNKEKSLRRKENGWGFCSRNERREMLIHIS